jgi:hypothetical protein
MNKLAKRIVADAYIDAALWTSEGDWGPNQFDNDGEFDDATFARGTTVRLTEIAHKFYDDNFELIEKSGLELGQVGHDIWLTQNGLGAGFWDRGLGEVGGKLTDAAKALGGLHLYVQDGLIYVE